MRIRKVAGEHPHVERPRIHQKCSTQVGLSCLALAVVCQFIGEIAAEGGAVLVARICLAGLLLAVAAAFAFVGWR